MMPKGSEFCAECGAPLDLAPGVGGSDTEVYPELAKANLLRMRKEYKQAEDVCLSILRRYPNNASANTLLGDICAEKGDLEQAAEWYELALDLIPDSAAEKAKLEDVRARLATKEKAATVETLGITHTSKPPYVTIAAVVVALLIVGVGVAVAVRGDSTPKTNLDGSKPLVVNGETPKSNPSVIQVPVNEPQKFIKDADLAKKIAEQLNIEHDRLIYAEVGEKDKTVVLTYVLKEDDDWVTRAKMVRSAFANAADAPTVTVKLMRDFKEQESQLVGREKYDECLSLAWQESTGATDEALVELFFGHKMEPKTTPTPVVPTPNTGGTPPIGEGNLGDGTTPPTTGGAGDGTGDS